MVPVAVSRLETPGFRRVYIIPVLAASSGPDLSACPSTDQAGLRFEEALAQVVSKADDGDGDAWS
jgi:hypothetical protein